jgi:Heparinase II/III-like protein/Heparinase II/III N-terminus
MPDSTPSAVAPATVRLVAEGDGLRAVIDDPAGAQDTLYAIYLLRNGERVAVRAYSTERDTRFAIPRPASGAYVATGFCHDTVSNARRKAHSAPLQVAQPALPPAAGKTNLPAAERVDSIEALAAQLRPDRIQRLDVHIDGLDYGLLTGTRRRGPLFVLLRGAEARHDNVQLPRFSRFSWRDQFPGTVVCIADPTLYLDSELKLGWYFGLPGHDVVNNLCRIVEVICGRLGLAVENAVFYGSSGGGFAALQCAARMGRGATAVAINPQTNVLDYYVERSVDAFLAVCTGGMTRQHAIRRFGPRLSAMLSWQQDPAGEARCLIVQNSVDNEHYSNHFRPFAERFGLPDNGQTDDGRMASIIYDHPSGHAAEPTTLLPRILKTAMALKWRAGSRVVTVVATAAPHREPAATPAPVGGPHAGRRRIPVAPLSERPSLPGGPIRLAQLYLSTTATRAGSRPGTISYRPRSDVAAVEIDLPLDWSLDPFKDRNWNAQLHMWRLGDFALQQAERTQDRERMAFFVRIMMDWHRHHLVEQRESIYAWQDMMVGIRAMKLAYVVSLWQHGHVDLRATELAGLHDLVETHLGFLLNPAQVRYSNHTLSDLHGALALARVVDTPVRQQIEAFVREVFPKVLEGQFDSNGVHRENSVGYHRYGINYLRKLMATGWFDDFGLREVVERAEAVLPWFLLPDGRTAPIGDTDGAAPPAKPGPTVFQGRDEVFSRSGYVILRDDGGGDAKRAAYLFFMGAYNSKFHKQSDDLSMLWYHGEDILCDAGKYAYKTDDWARYAVSRRAHNTVEVDTPHGTQLPDTPYGSAVHAVTEFDGGRRIDAAVTFGSLRVQHQRSCLHSLDGWLLVIDRLRGAARHDYVQWWHLAPRIVDPAQRADGLDARLPSGRALTLRFLADRGAKTELVRGVDKPRLQGWVSQAYREIEPNLAFGIRQHERQAWFATLIAIDAPASTLQRNGQRLTLQLAGGQRPAARYTIELGTDTFCVVRRES